MTTTTLADVATSAAAAVGVAPFTDALGIGPTRHVVVCLIDGLGANLLERQAVWAPRLSALSGPPINAVFPTTTPVGLGSFGTGLLPGMHGMVGASFMLPEIDDVLTPLQWGGEPYPVAVQPERTVFESVARAGITMTTVSHPAYRNSGLTRAVLRGSDYHGAEGLEDRVAEVASVLTSTAPSFTYVYWSELDRTGHEFGVDSVQWRTALARADHLVGGLIDSMPSGAALVVTADHGMVDCQPADRIEIEANPLLTAGVIRVAGEPRARHVYVRDGAAADVAAAWSSELAGLATVHLRQELVDQGMFGPVEPALADRIGDVMAVSNGSMMLASRVDKVVSGLIGQHGALTADELLIPALVHRRD